MTTHAFKQPEPVEYNCNSMNHHAELHNCDPLYMKKKPSNMMIWTFNSRIDYELILDCSFGYSLEIIFRNLNIYLFFTSYISNLI